MNNPNRNLAAIRVAGADRVDFLQGQLTQDIAAIEPGKATLAGWNSAKGRLLCTCWVINWQDAIWLVLPAALATDVARRLGMFVLRAAVTIEQPELSIAPARPRELPIELGLNLPEEITTNSCFYDNSSLFIATSSGHGLLLGDGADSASADWDAWRLDCIRAGVPVIWPETREEFVPQMVNLDLLDGISFTKGCYVGQEIVARTQNLGRIKRRMYAFTLPQADVAPGAVVECEGRTVGQVVDSVAEPEATRLLAVIRIEDLRGELRVNDDRLALTELPYDVPETI